MLILLTGKSNHDYIYNLTDHSIFTQLLASLEKLMITLRQKKQAATNLRKKAERHLTKFVEIKFKTYGNFLYIILKSKASGLAAQIA